MRDDQNQAGAIVGPLTNGLPILVAVCTRDWNAFRQTENYRLVVQQLAEQRKKGRNIQLLIVDNSGVALSQKEQITPNFATLIYEPRIGIPFARNAALEWALRAGVEWMVFIDDDVQPVHDWLESLLEDFSVSNADVLQGVTIFTYPDDYPDYYPRIQDRKFPPGEPLVTGSTENVIFRTAPIRELDLNFDVGLAEYGGSDADFFFRLHRQGASILHSPNAVVVESLHGVRASLIWQVKRRIRTSQSWFFAIGGITPDGSSPWSKKVLGLYRNGLRIVMAFLLGTLALLVHPVRGRERFLQALMDLMPLIALVLSTLGIRVKEYKRPLGKAFSRTRKTTLGTY